MQEHDFRDAMVCFRVEARLRVSRRVATLGREIHRCMQLGGIGAGTHGRREVETLFGVKLRLTRRS